jgi:choline-glycine betaine transporter
MEYSCFHWTFHPWAMYAVLGLALVGSTGKCNGLRQCSSRGAVT